MTRCMWEVVGNSLTCFVFSLRLLRSLWCFIDIPECKTDVKLKCEVRDVMPVKSYGKFAHLLRIFSEATSLTIVFQRHPRMQDRRTTKLWSFHDAMHVGSYEQLAHLLRILSEATSLTIAFHWHPRMQDRRQTKMWSSWRDACGQLWTIRSPASYFLRGDFAHYSVSETSQNARPT